MARPKKPQPIETKKTNKVNLRPLSGYVLVEPSGSETTTASGIVLPETVQEKKNDQGLVVAIGDDIYFGDGRAVKSPVVVGDKVVFKKWGSDEIKVMGIEYKIVKFEDLIAVLEG